MYTENRSRSASIVMRMCSLRSIEPSSKLIILLISNKKEFNHISLKVEVLILLNNKRVVNSVELS